MSTESGSDIGRGSGKPDWVFVLLGCAVLLAAVLVIGVVGPHLFKVERVIPPVRTPR